MLTTIAGALLPVLFMLALGYGAGRAHAFPKDAVAVITTLVLDFALPASLFVSTALVSREALVAEAPLFYALAIVVAAVWGAVFLLGRVLFHHSAAEASIQAVLVSLAAIPFYGQAVLSPIIGAKAGIGVSIGSIVVNVIAVPLTTMALALGGNGKGASAEKAIGGALLTTLKTPYIVAPIAGVVLVLAGLHLPSLLVAPLQLAGNASSAVGLFVAGLTLAAVKLKITGEMAFNVVAKLAVMPALFVGLAVLFGAKPPIVEQGALLAGLPCGPIAVLLATRHKIYEAESSTALAVSSLAFIATLPIMIVLFAGGHR